MSVRTNVHSYSGDLEVSGARVAVSTDIPTVSGILNSTNVGASFSIGPTASVSITPKPLPSSGVDFDFVVPKGDTGEMTVGSVSVGTTGSITNVGTATSATYDFVLPRSDDGTALFSESGNDIYYTAGNVGIGGAPPTGKKLYVDGTLGVGDIDLNTTVLNSWSYATQKLESSVSFARSVAVSGNGDVFIVGSSTDNFANVYRYDTSTSDWIPDAYFTGTNNFGHIVDISNDGNVAIVGTQTGNYANVYKYDGSTWDNGTTFVGTSSSYFGSSVCISGDGNTIAMGAFLGNFANVYRYNGSTWDTGYKIEGLSSTNFGVSVGLSNDGNTLIVGASSGNEYANVYRYNTTTAEWDVDTQFTGSGLNTDFGSHVALSGNGNVAIVGAYNGSYANVYRYDGSVWDSGTTFEGTSQFGHSVNMSGDGNAIIIGSYTGNYANVYMYDGSVWDTGTTLSVSTSDYFGFSVGMSNDKTTIIVGAITGRYANVYKAETFLNVSKPIQADGSLLSFTGQHICTPHGQVGQGLIVSANKNAYTTLNGPLFMGARAIQSSESLPMVSLSTRENDPSVFGVVDHLEGGGTERVQKRGGIIVRKTKTLGDDRVIVNSLGEGAIWVVDVGGPLTSSDLITSSNVPGYGQRQSDTIFRNYTVAKITMDCDFNPPDVPVQVATTDENGKLKWEDTGETEKAYKIKYLDANGNDTDESEHVYKAAYVGCTYHCG